MADELHAFGRVAEIELDETTAVTVEQVDDEIIVAIAGIVCVHFLITADQALKLSGALALAAENASRFVEANKA